MIAFIFIFIRFVLEFILFVLTLLLTISNHDFLQLKLERIARIFTKTKKLKRHIFNYVRYKFNNYEDIEKISNAKRMRLT